MKFILLLLFSLNVHAQTRVPLSSGVTSSQASGFSFVSDSSTSTGMAFSKLGETLSSSVANANYLGTAGQYFDFTSISVTSGTWLVSLNVSWLSNGVTTTGQVTAGMSTTSGNSATGLTLGQTYVSTTKRTTSDSRDITGLTLLKAVSTTTTLYLKSFAETSTTNLQAAGFIQAVRITP